MLRFIIMMLVTLLLLPTASSVLAKGEWNDSLQRDISRWMRTISEQDAQFAPWRGATISVRTLGAGQHQWLVTVTKHGEEVGYMVVAELPEADASTRMPVFALLEYGSGEYLLFDDKLAPQNVTAVPIYNGFASYWKVTDGRVTQYIDAKTGERYPTSFQADPEKIGLTNPRDLVTAEKNLTRLRSFSVLEEDPFDSIDWLPAALAEPADKEAVSWRGLLERQERRSAVLSVSLFHDQVMAPFSIGSVHVWNEEAAYVGVWNEGLRFLPFAYANQVGRIVN